MLEQLNPGPSEPDACAPVGPKRRGRKPKSEADKQKHQVACRLTDSEMAQIEASCGAMTAGETLRTLALARRLPCAIPEINLVAYSDLAQASVSLHELARRANTADRDEIGDLTAMLAAFRLALLGVASPLQAKTKNEDESQGGEYSGEVRQEIGPLS